jgi:hypothetical protein
VTAAGEAEQRHARSRKQDPAHRASSLLWNVHREPERRAPALFCVARRARRRRKPGRRSRAHDAPREPRSAMSHDQADARARRRGSSPWVRCGCGALAAKKMPDPKVRHSIVG